MPPRDAQNHPQSLKRARSAEAGLGLLGILLAIEALFLRFAGVAIGFNQVARIAAIDELVLHWLQLHGTEGGESVFVAVSWLGSPVLFLVDVATAAWLARRRVWRLAMLWIITVIGGVALDEILKFAFQRIRPAVASEFIHSHSWSFPSGHALNSLVGYGMLAFILRQHTTNPRTRMLLPCAAATLILAIGFSRLYLGVHYLSDVTAGYLAGGAWLTACIASEAYARERPNSITRG